MILPNYKNKQKILFLKRKKHLDVHVAASSRLSVREKGYLVGARKSKIRSAQVRAYDDRA